MPTRSEVVRQVLERAMTREEEEHKDTYNEKYATELCRGMRAIGTGALQDIAGDTIIRIANSSQQDEEQGTTGNRTTTKLFVVIDSLLRQLRMVREGWRMEVETSEEDETMVQEFRAYGE